MHAENARLWRVDDWGSEEGAEHAAVGDSEGAALHVLNGELASAGETGQSCEFAFDLRYSHIKLSRKLINLRRGETWSRRFG